MAIDIDLLPLNWDAIESDPSTRDSTHIYTKRVPFDVTLTTPGTAQNLVLVDPERPTVNLVTNPSFETGTPPTGYTASGATLAQSATVARTAANSLRITPDNAAAGEGAFWLSPALATQRERGQNVNLVVSAYFNDNAGSGNGARIIIANTSGTALATGNTVALAAAWVRSTAFLPLTNTGTAYRVYLVTATQHGTVFYVDSFQAELSLSGAPTTYCDGTLGLNYEWESTAHASMSRRRRGLAVMRGYRLHTTRDIYLAEDIVASSTTGEFIRAGTDVVITNIDLKTRLSFINAVAGEAPRVYGTAWGVHRLA